MDNNLRSRLNLTIYKNRYLIIYIIIGFFSLLLEQFMIKLLDGILKIFLINNSIGFVIGAIFAFIFNARFNFKVLVVDCSNR